MLLFRRLLKFWYPEALVLFIRTYKNTLQVLEEDLAVTLMIRLLFTPLFHDTSIIGRILSFLFRLMRIYIGLLGFMFVSLVFLFISIFWFVTPPFMLISLIAQFIPGLEFLKGFSDLAPILIIGSGLFLHHFFYEAPKKLWQVKTPSDIWQTTKLKKSQITWENLLKSTEVAYFLHSLELNPADFADIKVEMSEDVLRSSYELAKVSLAKSLTEIYFFASLLKSYPSYESFLSKFDLSYKDVKMALIFYEHKRNKWRRVFLWDEDFAVRHLRGVNRGWLGVPTPALDAISNDLTRLASKQVFSDFIGRRATMSEVVNILSQEKDSNVLLIGSAGSGRSALVRSLAKIIVTGNAPKALATKRLVEIDKTKLLSNVDSEGELAEKIKSAFEEVSFAKNIIIFIDEIHELGIMEAEVGLNVYSLIKPYLESSSFQFIATTDPQNYGKIIERNNSLARIFHKVELHPASEEETFQIILERAVELARNEKINLTYLSIKEIVKDASQFMHDRVLPDSAISALEECKVLGAEDGWITAEKVRFVFEQDTNIPITSLDKYAKKSLLNLEETIHQKFIDQEEAVKKIADTLRRSAAKLTGNKRPIGSFLFVGPTGVGKTEVSKILAEIYFKSKDAYLRFDMSEYQGDKAVERLIGSEETPGILTEAIKRRPFALLLLDEFEKGDKRVLNLFLQILEDGRLTDSEGVVVDFTNTIIIATSNAASLLIAEELKNGMKFSELNAQVKFELLKVFKPELINRFDEIVIFKPLAPEQLQEIVKIKLVELSEKLQEQGYIVEFDPGLVAELTKRSYDPVMGARPLRRLIQDTLEANLSKLILEEKIQKGMSFKITTDLLAAG